MIHFTVSGQSHDVQKIDPDGLDPVPVSGDPMPPLGGRWVGGK